MANYLIKSIIFGGILQDCNILLQSLNSTNKIENKPEFLKKFNLNFYYHYIYLYMVEYQIVIYSFSRKSCFIQVLLYLLYYPITKTTSLLSVNNFTPQSSHGRVYNCKQYKSQIFISTFKYNVSQNLKFLLKLLNTYYF